MGGASVNCSRVKRWLPYWFYIIILSPLCWKKLSLATDKCCSKQSKLWKVILPLTLRFHCLLDRSLISAVGMWVVSGCCSEHSWPLKRRNTSVDHYFTLSYCTGFFIRSVDSRSPPLWFDSYVGLKAPDTFNMSMFSNFLLWFDVYLFHGYWNPLSLWCRGQCNWPFPHVPMASEPSPRHHMVQC